MLDENPYTEDTLVSLNELHEACQELELSYAIHHNDHNHSWYVSIDSPAPTERFVGKDVSRLEWAIDHAQSHVNKLRTAKQQS